MNTKVLGKTGMMVSEIGMGCLPIMRLSFSEAEYLLKYAFDKGINFYETGQTYLTSEEKIGKAFLGMREKVIIATKSMKRDEKGVSESIDQSLHLLKSDYIDLFQFHQVSQDEYWERIIGPRGALEPVLRAKKQGKIRHLGVSTHNINMGIKLIKTGLFDTIQFALNFMERDALTELTPMCEKMNVGMISMKPFAGGIIDDGRLAFSFLRQFLSVIPLAGFDKVEQIDEVIDFINSNRKVVTNFEITRMQTYREQFGKEFCRRCEYCEPCPNGVRISTCMQWPIICKRMGNEIAVELTYKAMDTIMQCIDCGKCSVQCPYNLPIQKLLQNYYSDYICKKKEMDSIRG
jgi:predicted aldo/keto reductase-like oxidoreductase